jgi:hypothetical protein
VILGGQRNKAIPLSDVWAGCPLSAAVKIASERGYFCAAKTKRLGAFLYKTHPCALPFGSLRDEKMLPAFLFKTHPCALHFGSLCDEKMLPAFLY